jgi:predicted transglutaminase-like cysteine proteinase
MRVDAIGPYGCSACYMPEPVKATELFNIINGNQPQAVDRPWWDAGNQTTTVFDVLLSFAQAQYAQPSGKEEKSFTPAFNNIYLQYPNAELEQLADKITSGLSKNDDKATAIIRWVLQNFPYKEDKINYGYEEMWVPPTLALNKGSGDCEDGAFLVHSLLIHSGIPYDRVRTYGGFVDAGAGAASGGHAWTAYRRETDDEWVILDSSYYPTMAAVKDRPRMRNQEIYVDNYFYFNRLYWVNLEGVDRIHNPGQTYSVKGILDKKLELAGKLISIYA